MMHFQQGSGDFQHATPSGRYVRFGVREHAMASIVNGMCLSKVRGYGSGFLIFCDYAKAAIRLAAIMEIRWVHVFTHDSIGVGEDGPTHQPVEHVAALRVIPNLDVIRPADANETAHAWLTVMGRKKNPAGLALSRQNLPVFERGEGNAQGEVLAHASNTARGAYILAESNTGSLDVILIATGSEVQLALAARAVLGEQNIGARVVSAPCLEWFAEQDEAYRTEVLPAAVRARVAVEAGSTQSWHALVGDAGAIVGIDHFGASADFKTLFREFGITTEAVVEAAHASLARI